jgi:hypothetical protein
VGLWLTEALVVGQGDGVAEADADAEAVGVALADPVGVLVALAEADADGPDALADAVAELEDVGDPEQGVGVGVEVETARPAVAGITSRAPIATVPVATAPTTDAADRLFRACLGTVAAPNCCRSSVHSDHAPQRAHHPTVTNPASPGHPPEAR